MTERHYRPIPGLDIDTDVDVRPLVGDPAPDTAALRPLTHADRDALGTLVGSIAVFSDVEKAVALEVLDAYLAAPDRDYRALGVFGPAGLLGYACWGPTPCTEGTWDLYWIAVAAGSRRHGVGARLMVAVEAQVRRAGGRLLLIETSSRDDYAPTRRFYEERGYTAISRIPDFYAPGDDRVTYARAFDHA